MSRGKNPKSKINFTKEIDFKNYYLPMEEKQNNKNTKYNLIHKALVYD